MLLLPSTTKFDKVEGTAITLRPPFYIEQVAWPIASSFAFITLQMVKLRHCSFTRLQPPPHPFQVHVRELLLSSISSYLVCTFGFVSLNLLTLCSVVGPLTQCGHQLLLYLCMTGFQHGRCYCQPGTSTKWSDREYNNVENTLRGSGGALLRMLAATSNVNILTEPLLFEIPHSA